MTDRATDRYQQLYRHYADWYQSWAEQQRIPLDVVQRHEYAQEHADRTYETELANDTNTQSLPVIQDVPPALVETRDRDRIPETPALSASEPDGSARVGSSDAVARLFAQAAARQAAPVADPAPAVAEAAAPAHGPTRRPASVTGDVLVSRRRRGRVLGISLGAGGVVAIGALVAAGAFLVPGMLGGADASAALLIDDIPTAPVEVWSYEPDIPAHHMIWTAVADDGDVLVGTTLDVASWQEAQDGSGEGADIAWYEGVDADYEAGWAAGQAYLEAYSEYERSLATPRPLAFVAEETFYPTQFDGIAPADRGIDDDHPHAGAFEGWDDAVAGEWHGYSLPADFGSVDAEARLALVDIETGDERWSIDVADVVPDYEVEDTWRAVASGSGEIVVWDAGYNADMSEAPAATGTDDMTTGVAVLDAASGEVVSSAAFSEPIVDARIVADDVLVAQAGAPRLAAWTTGGLDGEPEWSIDLDEPSTIAVVSPGIVAARGETADALVDVRAGEALEWTRDAGLVVSPELAPADAERRGVEGVVAAVAGTLVTAREGDGSIELAAVDAETGGTSWQRDGDTSTVLLDDRLFGLGPRGVELIDPATGETRWTAAGTEGLLPVAVAADDSRVLLAEQVDGAPEGAMQWIDLETGEPSESAVDAVLPTLATDVASAVGGHSVRLGDSMIYAVAHGGGLLAFEPDRTDPVWRFSDEYVIVGTRILSVALDSDGRATGFSLLGAG